MVNEIQYDYVILTVSDLEGNIIRYSGKKAIKGTYINTQTFIEGLEGISISVHDDFLDFVHIIKTYKKLGCKYISLLHQ